eukprot:1141580-Pelagomonas_calceolata.AAC.3
MPPSLPKCISPAPCPVLNVRTSLQPLLKGLAVEVVDAARADPKGLAVEDVDAAKADPEVGLAQQQVAGSGGAPLAATAAAAPSGTADHNPPEGATIHSRSEDVAGQSPPEGASARAVSGTQGVQGARTSVCPSSTSDQEQPQGDGQPSQQHEGQQPPPPQQPEIRSESQQELPDQQQQQQQHWPVEGPQCQGEQVCTQPEPEPEQGAVEQQDVKEGRPECEAQGVDAQGKEQPLGGDSKGTPGNLPLGVECREEGVLPEEEAQEVLRGLQVEDELLEQRSNALGGGAGDTAGSAAGIAVRWRSSEGAADAAGCSGTAGGTLISASPQAEAVQNQVNVHVLRQGSRKECRHVLLCCRE